MILNENLKQNYIDTRNSSIRIVSPLYIEDYIPQPVDFVSPPKWNLAHSTWFFEEFILCKYSKNYEKFHPKYEFLFNSYYIEKGDRLKRNMRGALSRPTVEEVISYRNYVDEKMENLIEHYLTDDIVNLIVLGIHHEMQHQELFFTDLKYTWSLNPLHPSYSDTAFVEDRVIDSRNWIKMNEGIYEIGFKKDGFCFDNEKNNHKVFLHDFEIRNNLITNGEFIEFIENGGYKNYIHWHEEGWNWVQSNRIQMPMYWTKIDKEYFQYTLAGLKMVEPDHILTHISYFEAYAFLEWKGYRLPTEYEWEVASDFISWGDRWEWTSSSYLPYPGFKKNLIAGEYNGKFMVNQQVLRGSSVVTPPGHSRKTYRNFFHPHIGYQFNGIRPVKK